MVGSLNRILFGQSRQGSASPLCPVAFLKFPEKPMTQTQKFHIQATTAPADTHWQLRAVAQGQRAALNQLGVFEKQQARSRLIATEQELLALKVPIQASKDEAINVEFAIVAAESELAFLREFGTNSGANLRVIERIDHLRKFGW
jgi:hypothetical protein